jgi:hypothetical protein
MSIVERKIAQAERNLQLNEDHSKNYYFDDENKFLQQTVADPRVEFTH